MDFNETKSGHCRHDRTKSAWGQTRGEDRHKADGEAGRLYKGGPYELSLAFYERIGRNRSACSRTKSDEDLTLNLARKVK